GAPWSAIHADPTDGALDLSDGRTCGNSCDVRAARSALAAITIGASNHKRFVSATDAAPLGFFSLHRLPDLPHLQDKAPQEWLSRQAHRVIQEFHWCAGPIDVDLLTCGIKQPTKVCAILAIFLHL